MKITRIKIFTQTQNKNVSIKLIILTHTLQALSVPAPPQPGQPFVPSSQSHIDFACFQKFLPNTNEYARLAPVNRH